jgi:hypothetical protein
MLLVFAHTHPSRAVSRVSASFATRLARRTSAPTTACERSTHPAPSSTSPSRCTPAPRRHPGPTTAPAETTQNGPTAVSGARRARGWTDAVGSTRARVAGGEASPRVPRTRDACGRVASRAARTSARDRHAISSVGSSRRLPREKATFLVVHLTGRAGEPERCRAEWSGVHARVSNRFVCVWEIFRGIIERGSRVTDGGISFFRHVRREKIEAPTP